MRVTLICAEQSFDPGFTLRVAVDRDSVHGYIVDNKTKLIVRSLSLPDHEAKDIALYACAGDLKPLQDWMDKNINAYQFHVGWRTKL